MRATTDSAEFIRQVLDRFPHLPDCAVVPIKVACAITSRSKSSLYRDMAKGRIKSTVIGGSRLVIVGSLRGLTNK